MRTGNGKARLDRTPFACSAHLQVSICLDLQCPPEGGLYNSEKSSLPVAVISTVIVAVTVAAIPAAAMFLWRPASFAFIRALVLGPFFQLMPFRDAISWPKSMDALVGMRIFAAVHPGSPPPGVVDEYAVPAPVKAVIAPAPRPEESSERYAIAETNPATDKETGTRREENDSRVVVRHNDKGRVHRHDRDIRTAANDNLTVAP